MLLLLFSVHAFNAPDAVYKWIDGLDTVKHISAAVISVSGAGDVCPNTACRVSSIKRLTKKGYHVLYERMIVMPSNWVAPAPGSTTLYANAGITESSCLDHQRFTVVCL